MCVLDTPVPHFQNRIKVDNFPGVVCPRETLFVLTIFCIWHVIWEEQAGMGSRLYTYIHIQIIINDYGDDNATVAASTTITAATTTNNNSNNKVIQPNAKLMQNIL